MFMIKRARIGSCTEKMIRRKAQITLEATVLIAIITVALIVMLVHIKRALQGKLRASADDIGEQYSPTKVDSYTNTTSYSRSTSETHVENYGTLDAKSVTTSFSSDQSNKQEHEQVKDYGQEPMF